MRILGTGFIAALLFFAAVPALPGHAGTLQPVRELETITVVSVPDVSLEHWRNTPLDERYAFLLGFISMLEMERAWQGQYPLSIEQSTVGGWTRGLSGVSLQNMNIALDRFISAHPNQLNMNVLEALGRIYVRPKLTKAEQEAGAAHYRAVSRPQRAE